MVLELPEEQKHGMYDRIILQGLNCFEGELRECALMARLL